MSWFDLLLVGAAVVIAGVVIYHVGGWLLNWARNAVIAAIRGVRAGLLQLVRNSGALAAFAFGRVGNRYQHVETIEIDESQLDPEVLDALRANGKIQEQFDV